jgi:hypothetical protein
MSGSESITIARTAAMTAALSSLLSILTSTSFPSSVVSVSRYASPGPPVTPARISSTVRTACGKA